MAFACICVKRAARSCIGLRLIAYGFKLYLPSALGFRLSPLGCICVKLYWLTAYGL
jgi:hypothetical protein